MKKITDLKLDQWNDQELIALFDCLKEKLGERDYEFVFDNLDDLHADIADIHDELSNFIENFKDVMRSKRE
jgi:hypothetical protein